MLKYNVSTYSFYELIEMTAAVLLPQEYTIKHYELH